MPSASTLQLSRSVFMDIFDPTQPFDIDAIQDSIIQAWNSASHPESLSPGEQQQGENLSSNSAQPLTYTLSQIPSIPSRGTPATTPRCRPREASATPRQHKRRQDEDTRFVSIITDKLELCRGDEEQLMQFAKLDVRHMMVAIQGQFLKLQEGLATSKFEDFTEGSTFKLHIAPKLKAALLNPTIWAYVQGIGNYIIKDMKTHHKAWKIPKELFDEPQAKKVFIVRVKKILTNFCSDAKKTILTLVKELWPIWDLVSSLAPLDYVVDEAHYIRWALLRTSFVAHQAKLAKGEVDSDAYWNGVDKRLSQLRGMGEGHPSNVKEQMIDALLRASYDEDRKQFPGGLTAKAPTKKGKKSVIPRWQKDLNAVLSGFEGGGEACDGNSSDDEQVEDAST